MLNKTLFTIVILFIATPSYSIYFFDEIPKNCFYPEGGFSPNELHSVSDGDFFDTKNAIQVGENGFIEYDFNKDKKPDYIFSEKENSSSEHEVKNQLVLCLSSNESASPSKERNVFRKNSPANVSIANGMILLNHSTTEHNYGYYGHFEKYQYESKTKKLILVSKSAEHRVASCCDEAYCNNYDFIKKKYREARECDPNMYLKADGTTTREVCEDTLIEGAIIKNSDGSYKNSPTKESVLKNYSPEACSF